jgi:hypothetical protein
VYYIFSIRGAQVQGEGGETGATVWTHGLCFYSHCFGARVECNSLGGLIGQCMDRDWKEGGRGLEWLWLWLWMDGRRKIASASFYF